MYKIFIVDFFFGGGSISQPKLAIVMASVNVFPSSP